MGEFIFNIIYLLIIFFIFIFPFIAQLIKKEKKQAEKKPQSVSSPGLLMEFPEKKETIPKKREFPVFTKEKEPPSISPIKTLDTSSNFHSVEEIQKDEISPISPEVRKESGKKIMEKRLSKYPPLKAAVIWKEILDHPKGFDI
jgi:hypothetical protein